MHQEVLTEKARKIFPKLQQYKNFYLAGGTALALQIGHRRSEDFDLFSPRDIPRNLLATAQNFFSEFHIIPSVNNSDELTIFVNSVKISFIRYAFPVLKRFVLSQGLRMLAVSELGATKAYTIGRRGSFKDYVDLHAIVSGKFISLDGIIVMAKKKYGQAFNGRLFLEQLIYMEDIGDTDIVFLKKPVTKKGVVDFFTKEIKKIKL